MDHSGRNGNVIFSKREELNYPPDELRRPDLRVLMQVRKRCVLDSNCPPEATPRNEMYQPLLHLSRFFHLTPFEEQCPIICLALEPDKKYEKVHARLDDDMTCKQPSIGLVADILCAGFTKRMRRGGSSADPPEVCRTCPVKLEMSS